MPEPHRLPVRRPAWPCARPPGAPAPPTPDLLRGVPLPSLLRRLRWADPGDDGARVQREGREETRGRRAGAEQGLAAGGHTGPGSGEVCARPPHPRAARAPPRFRPWKGDKWEAEGRAAGAATGEGRRAVWLWPRAHAEGWARLRQGGGVAVHAPGPRECRRGRRGPRVTATRNTEQSWPPAANASALSLRHRPRPHCRHCRLDTSATE